MLRFTDIEKMESVVCFEDYISKCGDVNLACLIKWAASSGRDCPTSPVLDLPVCVLASEGAKEKQRISSVLTVDDPHGSCMLKHVRQGSQSPAVSEKHKQTRTAALVLFCIGSFETLLDS